MVKSTTRVALYARVSTRGQTVENQLRELREVAQRHGWHIVEEFVDKGISGAKGRDKRPNFDALFTGVTRREFDMVGAWSVDRLGRSLLDVETFFHELERKGVDLYLHQQALDTSTPAGRALFQMCGVFAQFERAILRERVNAGLARARAKGVTLGRPKVGAQAEQRIRELAGTMGRQKIAREVGVGVGTVQRVLGNAR